MKRLILCMLLMFSSLALGQTVVNRLTNQDIIALTKVGLSDDVIIAKIRSADAVKFDTSVEGLRILKAGNVSEAVMKVMLNPASVSAPVGATPAIEARDPNLPPAEVGVYWKNGTTFVLIPGEAIRQTKVGGRARSFFTYGIRSKHWDAYLDGPTSDNRVNDHRPLFYIFVPDGASASDFVLIRLEKKDDRREFQVGSFGSYGTTRSGVPRDKQIAFESEHIGIRTYKITLDNDLPAGEYAFFMATGEHVMSSTGGFGAGSGSATTGRTFDFSIRE